MNEEAELLPGTWICSFSRPSRSDRFMVTLFFPGSSRFPGNGCSWSREPCIRPCSGSCVRDCSRRSGGNRKTTAGRNFTS